jgi:hypothetical protein
MRLNGLARLLLASVKFYCDIFINSLLHLSFLLHFLLLPVAIILNISILRRQECFIHLGATPYYFSLVL